MATLPLLPRWGETTTGTTTSNISVPPSGLLDAGWSTSAIPPSSQQNWFQFEVYKWIQLLAKAFPFSSLGLSQIFSPLTAMFVTTNLNTTGMVNCLAAQSGVNGVMVAAAKAGTNAANVYSTQDGVNWSSHAHNLAAADTPGAISWVPFLNLFVITGATSSAHVSTSPDGITWTARTGAGTGTISDLVAFSGSVVVTSGTANTHVQWSTNGTTWTDVAVGTANSIRGLMWHAAAGLFVLTSSGGTTANAIYTSPDGNTWTARTSPSANLGPCGYGDFANAKFWPSTASTFQGSLNPSVGIILENTSGKLWSTVDGIAYIALNAGAAIAGGSITSYSAFYWTGSVLFATGGNGLSIESTDGITFVARAIVSDTPTVLSAIAGMCMYAGALWLVGTGTSLLPYKGGVALPFDFATQN